MSPAQRYILRGVHVHASTSKQNMVYKQLPFTASQVDSDVLHPMFLFQLYALLYAYADDESSSYTYTSRRVPCFYEAELIVSILEKLFQFQVVNGSGKIIST